jgi:hypothetical protein
MISTFRAYNQITLDFFSEGDLFAARALTQMSAVRASWPVLPSGGGSGASAWLVSERRLRVGCFSRVESRFSISGGRLKSRPTYQRGPC